MPQWESICWPRCAHFMDASYKVGALPVVDFSLRGGVLLSACVEDLANQWSSPFFRGYKRCCLIGQSSGIWLELFGGPNA